MNTHTITPNPGHQSPTSSAPSTALSETHLLCHIKIQTAARGFRARFRAEQLKIMRDPDLGQLRLHAIIREVSQGNSHLIPSNLVNDTFGDDRLSTDDDYTLCDTLVSEMIESDYSKQAMIRFFSMASQDHRLRPQLFARDLILKLLLNPEAHPVLYWMCENPQCRPQLEQWLFEGDSLLDQALGNMLDPELPCEVDLHPLVDLIYRHFSSEYLLNETLTLNAIGVAAAVGDIQLLETIYQRTELRAPLFLNLKSLDTDLLDFSLDKGHLQVWDWAYSKPDLRVALFGRKLPIQPPINATQRSKPSRNPINIRDKLRQKLNKKKPFIQSYNRLIISMIKQNQAACEWLLSKMPHDKALRSLLEAEIAPGFNTHDFIANPAKFSTPIPMHEYLPTVRFVYQQLQKEADQIAQTFYQDLSDNVLKSGPSPSCPSPCQQQEIDSQRIHVKRKKATALSKSLFQIAHRLSQDLVAWDCYIENRTDLIRSNGLFQSDETLSGSELTYGELQLLIKQSQQRTRPPEMTALLSPIEALVATGDSKTKIKGLDDLIEARTHEIDRVETARADFYSALEEIFLEERIDRFTTHFRQQLSAESAFFHTLAQYETALIDTDGLSFEKQQHLILARQSIPSERQLTSKRRYDASQVAFVEGQLSEKLSTLPDDTVSAQIKTIDQWIETAQANTTYYHERLAWFQASIQSLNG